MRKVRMAPFATVNSGYMRTFSAVSVQASLKPTWSTTATHIL